MPSYHVNVRTETQLLYFVLNNIGEQEVIIHYLNWSHNYQNSLNSKVIQGLGQDCSE